MRIGVLTMLALVLSACGSKTEEGTTAKQREAAATARALGDDEVAAVQESQGTPLAKVRFVLDSRPVTGKPFNVKLIVSSAAPVPQLRASVDSKDLVIDPASVTLVLGEPAGSENSTARSFAVTARQEGLAELSVHLTTDADTPETLYVIPVLVGKPDPAGGASVPASDKPDPAAAGNNAQPQKG